MALELSKSTQQVNDANYKMAMIDRENQVLKLEASNAKKFKQLYEEIDQEKRLTENNLRSTTKTLKETQLQQFQSENKSQLEPKINNDNKLETVEIEKEKKLNEIKIRQILVSFSEFTVKLSEKQLDLMNRNLADYLTEYQEIISELKTWGNILEKVISSVET